MVRHTCNIQAHVYGLQDCVRSAPVLIQEVGTTHVRVYPPGDSSSPDLVKVVTAVEGATVFVYFTQEIGPWPFRIENDSDFQFWLTQSVSTHLCCKYLDCDAFTKLG